MQKHRLRTTVNGNRCLRDPLHPETTPSETVADDSNDKANYRRAERGKTHSWFLARKGGSGYRLWMKTSAGSLKRTLSFRTCSSVSLRCFARNMETALSDPNSGIKSRWVRSCCSRRNRTTETASATGIG